MATRTPLVLDANGNIAQLAATDTLPIAAVAAARAGLLVLLRDGVTEVSLGEIPSSGAGTGTDTDPLFQYVKLLLHMDGSEGTTVFSDVLGGAVGAYYGACVTTADAVFDGAGKFTANRSAYIKTESSPNYALSGEFCIECRIKFTSLDAGTYLLGFLPSPYVWLCVPSAGTLQWYVFGGGLAGGSVQTGVYYHVALTRDSSGVVRAFLNGATVAATSAPVNQTSATSVEIGGTPSLAGGGTGGRCYIDEFRLTIGAARYTTDFTPPVAASPDA